MSQVNANAPPEEYAKGNVPLPMLATLGLEEAQLDLTDPQGIAEKWFSTFKSGIESKKVQDEAFVDLFSDFDSYWRDLLAITWDYRTFRGAKTISAFLSDRVDDQPVSNFQLDRDPLPCNTPHIKLPRFIRPVAGLLWLQAFFTFDTREGKASGIFRLIPHKDGSWRAFTVFSMLESINGHEENLGDRRPHSVSHGTWIQRREEEREFKNAEPTVLIMGGGQSGLDTASRLKALGVTSLVVEKSGRIGDQWRNRYKFLTLHDPVWYDHLPYLKFPDNWPVYTPAAKLANWLESYAETFELNVWTSSTVTKIDYDDALKRWDVTVARGDGNGGVEERILHPNHVVTAVGIGLPKFPHVEDKDKFEGTILHSTQHKDAKALQGKQVAVVGSCTSSHDICQDLYQNGVSVTMIQRNPTYIMSVEKGMPVVMGDYREGGPPTEIVDMLGASFPLYISKGLAQFGAKKIAELDKELLDDLKKVGFKTYLGIDGSGFLQLSSERAGGYYLDVGCSRLIADQKIKLKSGSVKGFTKDSVLFEDGSTLKADVVIFATGFGDMREGLRGIVADRLVDQLLPVWSLDKQYEMNSVWRYSGVPRLYFMLGNLAACRFQSRNLALQIKAIELGLFDDKDRYSMKS